MAETDGATDLLILGRIATLTGSEGPAWAGGIAIAGDRIVATGRAGDIEPLAGPATRIWRLGPELAVMPGITDAHLHLGTAAIAAGQLDLSDTHTLQEAMAAIGGAHDAHARAGRPSTWLLGHGWSPDRWGLWPTAGDVDAAAPGRPVALWSHDHHSRLLSSVAMRLADIGPGTSDPAGGSIRRGPDGEPTGVLHEKAANLADEVIPTPTAEEFEDAIAAYAGELSRLGIVGCHDPGWLSPDPEMRLVTAYRTLAERGRLPLHVHVSLRLEQLERTAQQALHSGIRLAATDTRGGEARLGWLKLFADGALGSRTAALLEPYEDEGERRASTDGGAGLLVLDPDELVEMIEGAQRARISTQIHAIGDRAVRGALDAFARVERDPSPLRRRIEHAQLVDPADVARFAALGVAASVQPLHIGTDAEPARRAWGARSRHAFPLRALDDAGALIPLGSDAPVERPDPWPGIALAVSRRAPGWPVDAPAFHPEHAISLDRAVRAACLDPLLVAADDAGGRLSAGYRADLIVVDAAAFDRPAEAMAAIRPRATLVRGREVHRDASFDP